MSSNSEETTTSNISEKKGNFDGKDYGNKKSNFFYQLCVVSLLMAPLIMGILINSLGNIEFVKYRIAVQLALGNDTMDPTERGLLVPEDWLIPGCLYPLGGFVGSVIPGSIMERWGTKAANIFFIINVLLGGGLKIISYWTHFALLWLGRFLEGIGSAGLMVSAVVLMFELITHKGAAFAKPLIQISVNVGILVIAFITLREGAGYDYQYTFIVPMIFGVLLFIVVIILPESPVYLASKKRTKEADEALRRVHGENADFYIHEMKTNVSSSGTGKNVGFKEMFTSKRYRGAVLAMMVMMGGQQLSGINCIIAFTPTVLSTMNIGRSDQWSLIILASALVGSVVWAPLVSKWKRKTLMIIGHACMTICLVAMLITFYLEGPAPLSMFLFSFFVFIFNIAPGPLVWFISIEIFPKNAIKTAQTIGVTVNWLSNSIVYGVGGSDINVMIFYAIVNALVTLYLIFFVCETLNRSSEEILDEYEQRFQVCKCC